MERKEIGVALLGFGNVGSGTYEVLKENFASIEKKVGAKVVVKKILVRNSSAPRRVELPPELATENFEDILGDAQVHIVAELMGGVEPAAEYMVRALKASKHVVTANKAALAAKLPEIYAAAKASGCMLRYEAAVCGAVPVMEVIAQALSANSVSRVAGIVNGTTNYILTRMAKEGASYAEVLKDAQRLGFAEADPAGDVEGFDAENKLVLLIWEAFGLYMPPGSFERSGISSVSAEDLAAARARGNCLKLVASAEKTENGVKAEVGLREVPEDSFLGRCGSEYNAVQIDCDMAGPIFLQGRGAGPRPTGSAVGADIIAIAKAMLNRG